MRTLFFILSFLTVPCCLPAQITNLHITQGCSYDDALDGNDLYLYDASNEAERIVAEIVDALGLTKNFSVRSANVPNALATSYNGTRYIMYSTAFLEKFKADANTQWAAYSVMAHEIGHHLNGHNFAENNPKTRKMLELEADQFSGSVLRMLGASLDEAQAGLNTFYLHGETNTHPPTAARKEAVSNGWKKRDEWLRERGMTVQRKVNKPVEPSFEQPKQDNHALAVEWTDKAIAEKDNAVKIDYYSKAIQYDPLYAIPYINRGIAKKDLGRDAEALIDYDKAIQLDPSSKYAYNARGVSKQNQKKYNESIADFDKAIKLDPNFSDPYNNRGLAYQYLGRNTEAVADFDRALQIFPNYPQALGNKGCSLVRLGRYSEAVDLINRALKIDSNLNWARDCRAEALKELGKD